MLPTKEEPEFVFTSSTLAVATRWADLCAAAVGQSWLILALLGRTGSSQRWEVWLAWGWASPTFPKVWKVQVMRGTVWGSSSWCESLHTQVLVSQGWEFLRFDGLKSVEKSMIIRGPLKVRGLLISLLPFSFFYHMRALFLTTCSKTQALTRSSWASEVWHSGLAEGEEATTIPILQLMRCIGCLWLSSAILVDDQHRSREITRQPYGWPRNYVNIFSEISIGQWLCFSHMASFRSYGLGMWVYTTHKHCWAKISAWQAEHTLGTEDSVAKSPS